MKYVCENVVNFKTKMQKSNNSNILQQIIRNIYKHFDEFVVYLQSMDVEFDIIG